METWGLVDDGGFALEMLTLLGREMHPNMNQPLGSEIAKLDEEWPC